MSAALPNRKEPTKKNKTAGAGRWDRSGTSNTRVRFAHRFRQIFLLHQRGLDCADLIAVESASVLHLFVQSQVSLVLIFLSVIPESLQFVYELRDSCCGIG